MKKIQDIYTDKKDISIRDESGYHEIMVSEIQEDDAYVNDMQEVGELSELNIKKENKISVSKKTRNKGKDFDALEKKDFLHFIKRPRAIKLVKKKKTPNVQVGIIYMQRYFKGLSIVGWVFASIGIVFGIMLLGFLDKITVENRVNAGYEKLTQIRDGNLSISDIGKKVNDARFDLLLSDVLFSPFKLFPGDKVDSVQRVITGGRHVSRALDDTIFLYTKTDEFIAEKSLHRIYFTRLLSNIYPILEGIEESLQSTLIEYKAITWLPNDDLENKKDEAIYYIELGLSYLSSITENYETFLNIFGHDKRKRYLIVFQNADEIRPTGGFMGSMGLLEIYKGRVQLFQKKDVYGIEWNLKKADYERLPAPKGIVELTPTFGLRDANYYANVGKSSESIKFFTDMAGIDLDGVIYINQNILLKFLELTGPVYFEAIDREVTHENFSEIMSLLVEAKTFKVGTLGTPKQILFDFMEIFTQKLLDEGKYFDYVKIILHEVESRDAMIWSFNPEENALLSSLGVNGEIHYDSSLDFAYPVYTSLSGNKSDRYMKRMYDVNVKSVPQSCDFDVSFTLKSTHDMGKKKRENILALIDEYDLDSPNLFEIQGAARNRQYVRVILPDNAQIQPKAGMEIMDYGSKKGVEFFLDTQLQESSFFDFEYILENKECKKYDYTLYKQAGIPSYDVKININDNQYKYYGKREDFFFEKRD